MPRLATPSLLTRIRAVNAELTALALILKAHGDRETSEAVERAQREIQLIIRQGVFQSRGESV